MEVGHYFPQSLSPGQGLWALEKSLILLSVSLPFHLHLPSDHLPAPLSRLLTLSLGPRGLLCDKLCSCLVLFSFLQHCLFILLPLKPNCKGAGFLFIKNLIKIFPLWEKIYNFICLLLLFHTCTMHHISLQTKLLSNSFFFFTKVRIEIEHSYSILFFMFFHLSMYK